MTTGGNGRQWFPKNERMGEGNSRQNKNKHFCEVLEQVAQRGSEMFSKGFQDLTGQNLDKSILNSEPVLNRSLD